jgi:hypothetical protein
MFLFGWISKFAFMGDCGKFRGIACFIINVYLEAFRHAYATAARQTSDLTKHLSGLQKSHLTNHV